MISSLEKPRLLNVYWNEINTHLVRKNGIIIPDKVATKSKTTCRTVSRTFINLTTKARAFELSRPSNVTYCCC